MKEMRVTLYVIGRQVVSNVDNSLRYAVSQVPSRLSYPTNTQELQIWETYKRLAESQFYSEMSRGEYCLFVTACGAVIVGVGFRLHARQGVCKQFKEN